MHRVAITVSVVFRTVTPKPSKYPEVPGGLDRDIASTDLHDAV
jgi:hypothetical protein